MAALPITERDFSVPKSNVIPLAVNEAARLASVRSLKGKKENTKPALDALCQTVSELFNVPIVLVSLVEEHHQWFEANCGLGIDQTSREVSFCTHAIMTDQVFVIENALLDDRFARNPLVTGEPGIRFYAGAPLILDQGIRVGTLCVIDQAPRAFSKEDRLRLAGLASVVTELLRLRQSEAEAITESLSSRKEQELLAAANRSLLGLRSRLSHWTRLSSDWVWETDAEHRFVFVEGDSATHQLDFQRWIGKRRWEIAGDGLNSEKLWDQYRGLVDRREAIRNFSFEMSRRDGTVLVAEATGDPVFDLDGAFLGYRGITRDVTAREELFKRLKQAELIANETKHAIIITDKEGRITWVNPAFTEITGYTLEEVIGVKPGSVLQFSETSQKTVAEIGMALRSGQGIRTNILNIAKDGRKYWLDLEIRPVFDTFGALEGFIALENDVTDWVNENNRKDAIFENATAGIVIHDEWGKTVDCNQEALSILGLDKDQLLGRTAIDPKWQLVDADRMPLAPEDVPAIRALGGDEFVRNQIVGVRRTDGSLRWLRATAKVFTVNTDNKQVLVSFADVTEEENTRRDAEQARELLSNVIETIPDAIAAYDSDDRLVLFNAAYKSFYETSAPAIKLGAHFSDILSFGLAAGQYVDAGTSEQERREWLRDRMQRHRSNSSDTMLQLLDTDRWLQVKERRSDNGITVGVHTDITAIKRAEERVRAASETDHLTGLANRRMFLQRFQQAIKSDPHVRGLVALVDLDHFKDLNDTLGHDVGDIFLRNFSQRLLAAVRPGDVVARLGGDEFGLLFFGVASKTEAKKRLMQLVSEINQPFHISGKLIEPQMSIGVSIYPDDGREVNDLLKNADIALYETKKSGRNGVTVFELRQKEKFSRRAYVADCLREVIRSGNIDVAFQGQVDLKTGKHTGFEALARWSLDGVQISPAEFIPIADEFGLSAEIDLQVLAKSLSRLRILKDMGHETGRVAVNLGTLALRDAALVSNVKLLLADQRLEPTDLEIEVTENVMIGRGFERVNTNLSSLRALGISIALDDFGTGYASLTHLKTFPVDKLKIDRSFINEMTTSKSDAIIVKTLVSLGRALGMKIVGEGIETMEQHRILRECGCSDGQGYYFHKPDTSFSYLDQYLSSLTPDQSI